MFSTVRNIYFCPNVLQSSSSDVIVTRLLFILNEAACDDGKKVLPKVLLLLLPILFQVSIGIGNNFSQYCY